MSRIQAWVDARCGAKAGPWRRRKGLSAARRSLRARDVWGLRWARVRDIRQGSAGRHKSGTAYVPSMAVLCRTAGTQPRPSRLLPPSGPRRHRHAEEHGHGLIEPHHVLVIEPPDLRAHLRLGTGGDLAHHQAAGGAQAVALVRLHHKTEQRRVGRVGGEGANRDGVGAAETVVLHDDGGARLARIVLASGDGPDLAAPHASPQSETASMKA